MCEGVRAQCELDILNRYRECILHSGMKQLIQYLHICVMIAVSEQPLCVHLHAQAGSAEEARTFMCPFVSILHIVCALSVHCLCITHCAL